MSNVIFKLLGHDNPLGRYPAPVVPIGTLNDELVAIYAGTDDPQVVSVRPDALYVRHEKSLALKLQKFDYIHDRLFAFDEQQVEFYHVAEEQTYFKQLLGDFDFSERNPFLRLSLAKAVSAPDVLVDEVYRCVDSLSRFADQRFIDEWYKRERENLLKEIDASYYSRLPESWKVLLQLHQAKKPAVVPSAVSTSSTLITKPMCFVRMPFESRQEVYEHAVRPAAEAAGLECYLAEDPFSPEPIVRNIINSIFSADVVIADVSGRNPNVFYELGIAHTLGNKNIVICEQGDERFPFNLNAYRLLFYERTVAGIVDLRKNLETALHDVSALGLHATNPVQHFSPVRYAVPLSEQSELERTIEKLTQEVRHLQYEKLRNLMLMLPNYQFVQLKYLTEPNPYLYHKRPEFLDELRKLRTLGLIRLKENTTIGSLPETGDLKDYLELTDLAKQTLEELLRLTQE